MTPGVVAALALALLLGPATMATAHPGRLDATGCHDVHKDFTYKSGAVAKAGQRHCHRALGDLKLDGKEVLEDDDEERARTPGGEPAPPRTHEPVETR